MALQPPPNCVVAGDFNARHNAWDPGIRETQNAGHEIHDWAVANRLSYIGEIGAPTHAAGHTIDLTFSNIPFTTAEVDSKLQAGADHETIRISIPRTGRVPKTQYRFSVPENKLTTFAGIVDLGL